MTRLLLFFCFRFKKKLKIIEHLNYSRSYKKIITLQEGKQNIFKIITLKQRKETKRLYVIFKNIRGKANIFYIEKVMDKGFFYFLC